MMIFCVFFSLKQQRFASFFCLVITVFSLMNEAVRFHSRASIKIKFLTSHLSFYLNVYSNKRFLSLHCISSREQRACNRGSANARVGILSDGGVDSKRSRSELEAHACIRDRSSSRWTSRERQEDGGRVVRQLQDPGMKASAPVPLDRK